MMAFHILHDFSASELQIYGTCVDTSCQGGISTFEALSVPSSVKRRLTSGSGLTAPLHCGPYFPSVTR